MFPPLVLKKHENVYVVRDDLFPYGSKARFLKSFFRDHIPEKEVVYGSSPRWGFAQISIAYLAKRYGKKCTLFIAKAKERTEYTKRAEALGANIVEVPMGFLSVCESKSQTYAKEVGARLLPCGLDIPQAISEIKRIAAKLLIDPDEVWTVAGSGTAISSTPR